MPLKFKCLVSCANPRDTDEDNFRRTKQALEELGYDDDQYSTEDCRNLQYICSIVSQRAAFLASAGNDTVNLV